MAIEVAVAGTADLQLQYLLLRRQRAGVRRAEIHPLGELAFAADIFRVDS
jgi:hypothetical protein